MKKNKLYSKGVILLLLLNVLFLPIGFTQENEQNRIQQISNTLETLKVDNPGLLENVELSVSNVSIQEFLRGIANANNLNISVDPSIGISLTNNFANVSVADMLVFLAKTYQLDVQFTGNIIAISKYQAPTKEAISQKRLDITYLKEEQKLSLDIVEVSLFELIKKLGAKTGKNIVISPQVKDRNISLFIMDMPFEKAMSTIAFNTDLSIETKEGVYYVRTLESIGDGANKVQGISNLDKLTAPVKGLNLKVNGVNDITLQAEQVPIEDLIKAVSTALNVNYYFQNKLTGVASLNLVNQSYEQLLNALFLGTNYTYLLSDAIYLIGERKNEGLRKTIVYPLQHRTVDKMTEHIPTDLKTNIEIKEFPELNSLVLSGSAPVIDELSAFIKLLDQVVPVIAIEVIIVDYSKTRLLRTGISAGVGNQPLSSGGTLTPETQYDLGANAINKMLVDLDFGSSVNLGKVTPNFYLKLEAMEADGIVNIRSTPKLATLNGTEASLSIGSTQYYVQETSNVIGTQNPQTVFTRQYLPVNADLSVDIKPIVSGDNQITLEISVNQSDFTDRTVPEAPPNSVTRSFTSVLRVKNQEMILLGGLEEKSTRNNSSGLPLLARIPVIKWFFGKQIRDKRSTRLNILIKPTVIY